MNSLWTRHLKDEKEKENFERLFRNSRQVLDRLNEILVLEISQLEQSETSPQAFENPNWAAFQAYRNGQRFILKYLLKLLDQGDKDGRHPRPTGSTGN